MLVRQNYLRFLESVKSLEIACLQGLQSDVQALQTEIERQELLIPVIGGFSAGKSSLLNAFLGRDILGVAITPETAIATELRYSTQEHVEAVSDEGVITNFTLTDLAHAQAQASEFNHLKVFLNSAQLQAIEPLILVDMPGYNAPIEAHNKALLRYGAIGGGGVYFVALVCAATEKIITQSFLRELEGIKRANKQFSLALSKTNLVAPSDLEEIKRAITQQLSLHFNYTEQITHLDRCNGGMVLGQILQSIDKEALFKRIFHARLELLYFNVRSSLQTAITGLRNSQEQNQKLLDSLQDEIKHIQAQKEQALAQVQSRYAGQNLEGVLSEVRHALEGNTNLLVQSILHGGDLEREINNTVRTVLFAAIQRKLIGISCDVIEDFEMSIQGVAFDMEQIQTWADHLKGFVESSCFAAITALEDMRKQEHEDKKEDKSKSKNELSTAVATTTLAYQLGKLSLKTQPIVGAVLNALLLVLPGIFSKFTQIKKEEVLREKIANQVIPSILAQIRPKLNAYFDTQIAHVITQTGQIFSDKIAQKQSEIKEAQKEYPQQDTQARVRALEEQIQILENLSQQYLKE
ncbi:dynamin family protein [Helicobacter felis]|uniref:dynamin family protein n=1 Tax=Helicobacter felis TaxID=214 RepID=UPI0013CDF698|nr:dynamin family protein [Helicobacter felis]